MNGQRLADALGENPLRTRRRAVVAHRRMVDEHLLDRLVVGVEEVDGIFVRNGLIHVVPSGVVD